MKRKARLFLLAAFVVAGVAAHASQVYRTSCGKMVTSVEREFFDRQDEYDSYMRDLNEISCGNGTGSAVPVN